MIQRKNSPNLTVRAKIFFDAAARMVLNERLDILNIPFHARDLGMDMQQESDHRDSPGTDVGMLAGLANVENHECWNEFYRLYSKSILLTAAKAGLTQSEAEDVLQKTMMDVTKNIGTFTRRRAGSFRRWLTQLAAWRAADCVRRRDKCLENRAHLSGE